MSDLDARSSLRLRLAVALGVLLGLPALFGGWHLWVNRDRGPRPAPVQAAVWSREEPAPGVILVRLQGEGYALGRAEGQALGEEIRAMVRFLRDDYLGRGVLGTATRDWLLGKAWSLDAAMAPRFREELRGMADAAGVAYADLVLVNAFDDLQYLAGCSSAVVPGVAGGPLLHARNLDYPIARLARVKLIRDLHTRGVRIRSFGFPGFIGVLTGMSSRGLGLSSHTSASRVNRAGEPTGILYRRLLEEAGSLEEMQALVVRARRTIGNNLALSDGPRNQALALEFDADRVAVRAPDGGRILVTNHYWDPGLRAHQSEAWWTPTSGSQARVACLAQGLPAGAQVTPAQLQALFSREGLGKAWRTPANTGTVQSVVMQPATGRAWLATGTRIPVTRGAWLELPAGW